LKTPMNGSLGSTGTWYDVGSLSHDQQKKRRLATQTDDEQAANEITGQAACQSR